MPRRKKQLQPQSKPYDKAPPPPPGMKAKFAVEYWKRITPHLVELKVLTPLHLEALEVLCRAWNEYKKLSNWCDEHFDELIITPKNGCPYEHPNVKLLEKAKMTLHRTFPKFGLTPEGLAKIAKGNEAARPAAAANPFDEFSKRKTGK